MRTSATIGGCRRSTHARGWNAGSVVCAVLSWPTTYTTKASCYSSVPSRPTSLQPSLSPEGLQLGLGSSLCELHILTKSSDASPEGAAAQLGVHQFDASKEGALKDAATRQTAPQVWSLEGVAQVLSRHEAQAWHGARRGHDSGM